MDDSRNISRRDTRIILSVVVSSASIPNCCPKWCCICGTERSWVPIQKGRVKLCKFRDMKFLGCFIQRDRRRDEWSEHCGPAIFQCKFTSTLSTLYNLLFQEHVNVYKVSGFGLVLAHPTFDAWTNGKDGQVVWIQWYLIVFFFHDRTHSDSRCGDASKKYCWTVNSFINGKDDQQMTDNQLREIAEFIRNRKLKVCQDSSILSKLFSE